MRPAGCTVDLDLGVPVGADALTKVAVFSTLPRRTRFTGGRSQDRRGARIYGRARAPASIGR